MTAGSVQAGDVFGTGMFSKDAAKKVGASGRLAEHKPPASSAYYPQIPIASAKIDDLSLVAVVSGQQGNGAEPDPKITSGRQEFPGCSHSARQGTGSQQPQNRAEDRKLPESCRPVARSRSQSPVALSHPISSLSPPYSLRAFALRSTR